MIKMWKERNTVCTTDESTGLALSIVNKEGWLGSLANIKGANRDAKI